ncbi:unnamed protein product [Tilletia controversa]|uniref:ACT domain-containing protein n=3 Tax=Tilletia TaxID=13289 RepID=A0A8X7SWD3_9BASI|nr:hypothetical protein CF336_g4525 [Tilletia laevis]KAE8196257.1 hypothetical protein CF328_g4191 [Tilletia controversa]KAE8262203.1 hypothetical protein A4X03_0g2638 [Tilletia caries]KAE8201367.1 hypothetical protein CF335_g3755 [Tilletia laevis]KAE8246697.1 hypothetical protein A4X06_0g4911 [Tilletia controversa]
MSAKASSSATSRPRGLILTVTCPDKPGIVTRVTGLIARLSYNIIESAQFGDSRSGRFFMRVLFVPAGTSAGSGGRETDANLEEGARDKVVKAFQDELAAELEAQFEIHEELEKVRTLIMVSKIGHCIHDLLFRMTTKTLPIEIPLIISNHTDFEPLAKAHNIPFHYLPIKPDEGKTKEWQEGEVIKLCKEHNIELVVLARYMQILSENLCATLNSLPQRTAIINIHHSMLPAFAGGFPYRQAFERGVKLVGATAHFATADLDEGPIITQATLSVDHTQSPLQLQQEGEDVERRVLATAVKKYAQRRVFVNGNKTVVFS